MSGRTRCGTRGSPRLNRYHDPTVFHTHLGTHADTIADSVTLCPSPSCGMKRYLKHDLLGHMVMVHRLGVCRFDGGGPGHRLKLPPPPGGGQKRASPSASEDDPAPPSVAG